MLDLFLQASPEAIFIYDIEDLRFMEVNDAALEIYGYSYKDFIQMDLTDLYAPEDIQTLLDLSNVKNKEKEFTGPWRHKKRDGSEILVEISKMQIAFNGKKAYFNIVKDVTDKIKLQQENQLFDLAFNNINEPFFVTDKSGIILQANKSVKEILQYSEEEIKNRSFVSICHDENRSEALDKIFNPQNKEKSELKLKLKNKSEEFTEFQIISIAITDFNNEITGFSILAKPLNLVLAEDKNNAEEKPQQRTNFSMLSGMFHEILTPLNVILGFIQEITDSIDERSDEISEAVDIINVNRKILMATMDEIIEYSQIEQDEIDFNIKQTRFIDIFENAFEKLKKQVQKEKVLLEPGRISSSLEIKTDVNKFETLFGLFIKISAKITKEENLFISAYPVDDEKFILSIKDARSEISGKLANSLNSFFINEEDQFRNEHGISKVSIGLFTKLTNALGGKAEILSKENINSEFAIILPVNFEPVEIQKEIPEEKILEVQKNEKPSGENISVKPFQYSESPKEEIKNQEKPKPTKGLTGLDYSKLTCLYVEDQPDAQTLFKVQMRDMKEIDFSTNYDQAIYQIQKKKYDFIVVDINLRSQHTGVDVMRMIRTTAENSKSVVIAVTSYMLPGDREKFLAMGFDGFVSKPILKNKLTQVLERIFL